MPYTENGNYFDPDKPSSLISKLSQFIITTLLLLFALAIIVFILFIGAMIRGFIIGT